MGSFSNHAAHFLNSDLIAPCSICTDQRRDQTVICVVETIADLWAVERSNVFKGIYHVLGGTLSAKDNIGPDELRISQLIKRIKEKSIDELIIATNATTEGQTTAFYITDALNDMNLKITRLAQGIPIGAELDYLDEGTLLTAMRARHKFEV